MKRWLVFLLIVLIFLIVSCGTSAEEIATQTSTAATAIAASWTKTPTPTFTHTPTFTPTLTLTSTITPTITSTPLGGGSGQIVCEYCNGKPGISLINFDGTGEIYLTDKQNMGASFDWSKNGAKLTYFTIEGVTLPMEERIFFTRVIDGDNFSEQCFEIGGGTFSLSPDGSKMAIGEHSSKLYLVDIDSGKSEIMMEAPIQWSGWDVDWSPDGTKLAVAGGEIGIAVINILNNEIYSVVEADNPDYYKTPRWSPDGKKIVYVKRSNLFVVNADGSNETLLVQNAIHPIWSPDGTKIAYITGSNNQRKIFMMNIDGTNKVRLTESQYLAYMTWLSDGKYIIYTVFTGSRDNPSYDLYSVDVARQDVFSLAKNTGGYPTLSPDGSIIIYTTWVKSGDGYIGHTYLASMDGAIISELNIPGIIGPWRPKSIHNESNVLSIPIPPEGKIVIDEDFEDGVADGFLELSGNWGIIDDETNTNKILETRGSTDNRWANIGFGVTNLSNCAIEFRLRLVNYESIPDGGKTSISFRGQWGKGNFGLDLQPYWNNMSLRYEGDFGSNVWTRLDQENFSITKNNWYLIRLEIVQDIMTVYLDGKNVLLAHDDRLAPIFRFAFNVDNNAQVQFDDVRLWALPSPP